MADASNNPAFYILRRQFQEASGANPQLEHLVVTIPPGVANQLPDDWQGIVDGYQPRRHPLETGRNVVSWSLWTKFPREEKRPTQVAYLYGPGLESKAINRLASAAWTALPEQLANQALELLGPDRKTWPKLYVDGPDKKAPPFARSERWMWFVYWKLSQVPGSWFQDIACHEGHVIKRLQVDPFLASMLVLESVESMPQRRGIVQVIHDLGRAMEAHPRDHLGKDEETLRDHFVAALRTHYPNTTGETLNGKGKTDIFVQFEGQTVLVAECKNWKCPKGFHDAIDQLLGYLTWQNRDAAAVFFVRGQKVSAVLRMIEEKCPSHPCFVEALGKKNDGWFNFQFHLPGDDGVRINLSILVFHFPKADEPA